MGNLGFPEYGEENKTFGWQNLRDIFGDKVLYFNQDRCDGPSEDEVYATLSRRSLIWNREELRKMRMDKIPEYETHSHGDIIDIWNSVLSKYRSEQDAVKINVSEQDAAKR